MSVIIILLFLSIAVASLFLCAFIWSVRSGQFADEQSPSMRILFDDKPAGKKESGKPPLSFVPPISPVSQSR